MSRPRMPALRVSIGLALAALALACATEQNGKPIPSGADKQVKVPKPSPGSAEARATSEEVLETGGEIDLTQLPATTLEHSNGSVIAWGLVQAHGDANLEATEELADESAREELIGAVREGIASSATPTSNDSTSGTTSKEGKRDNDPKAVTDETTTAARSILPALEVPQHGWKKVRRNGEVVLFVCARISSREDAIISALAKALRHSPDPAAAAHQALDQLGSGKKLGAE